MLIFEFTSKIACDIYKLFSAYYNKLPVTVYINQRLTEHTTILYTQIKKGIKMKILLGMGKGSQERKEWDFSKDYKILQNL